MTLTQRQRAQRRATRRNNKISKDYPLLAQAGVINDWYTDEEAEYKTVRDHDIRWAVQWADHQMWRWEQALRALALRDRARHEIGAFLFGETMLWLYEWNLGFEYELDAWWRFGVR